MSAPPARSKPWAIGFGLAAAALVLVVDSPLQHFGESGARPARAAAVALLMALWWILEAVPIYWTALVPIVAYPLLGVLGGGALATLRATLAPYFDPYIFLFAGGMGIAAAMQHWNLHRRLALSVMRAIGTDPRHLLGGVLCATAFVSLWISNTATAAMMLPIGMALIAQLETQEGGRRLARYGMAVVLAVAYGSNLGGIGTKIGTAPNAQLSGFLDRIGIQISFLQFLCIGLPFVVLLVPVAWLLLWRLGRHDAPRGDARAVVAHELAALGPMRGGERIVLAAFATAAALWVASKPITAAFATARGAATLTTAHVEGGIAMAVALALVAARWRGAAVLPPRALRVVPWETLLLLGGGFAMAAGIQQSGLSRWLGERLAVVAGMPGLAQALVASLATVALSAVASNTATVAVMLPILRDAASPPMMTTVLVAATIAASCDFALPAGTPPNAIVFGSGYVRIPTMARIGIVLDLVAATIAGLWCSLVVPWVLGR
ncbi:MAG: SLC13 family permease [Thermoanaerobaculia bacterium]